jgi:hypothetical protein
VIHCPEFAVAMSATSPTSARFDLPPATKGLLRQVRSRIRRDSLLDGLLFFVCGVVVVFWSTMGLDSGWFLLQRLELPIGLRVILLVAMCGSSAWIVTRRILFPLVRRIQDCDVALLIERRFPQFQDRLITTVESARGIPLDGPLSHIMLQRSISEAEVLAGHVRSEDIFDARKIRLLAMIAGALLISVLIPVLINPQLSTRWWNAFIRCRDVYRVRTTEIVATVIAQPGDRRVLFSEDSPQPLYRHPRSADLELEFSVPADTDRPWIVPDRIRVDVLRTDGSRSRAWVSQSSSRAYRFVITQLREPVEIEVLAGDFRSRIPWRVDVVDTPGLDSIQLDCVYPEYTGWNELRERSLTVTGSEVPLPEGTRFELAATSAKPLQSARIVSEQFEISGDSKSSTLSLKTGVPPVHSQRPLISADGKTLTARFLLVQNSSPGEIPVAAAANPDVAATDGSASSHAPLNDGQNPEDHLKISSNTSLRFFLHDTDNVMSVSPETLRVAGIPDAAPVVVAQITGIGNSVTRRARIPVAGRIRDDYGIQAAGFEFQVDDETGWRPRPFRASLQQGITDYTLQRADAEPFEYFELQPLDLSEGQSLTLSVLATDGKPLPGPGVTRSAPLPFRIVSDDELLSLLYTREIALRARFEEIIAQLEEVRKDLTFHTDVALRTDAAGSNATQEDIVSLATCGTRSSNSLRRQANELNAIIEAFEEIMRQLVNNAIPLHNAETMQVGILDPLKMVSAEEMPRADRATGAFRAAAAEKLPAATLTQQAQTEVAAVISSLRTILENVRDLAEFHEALRDLKQLSDEQKKVLEETKKLQKNQLFEDLLK